MKALKPLLILQSLFLFFFYSTDFIHAVIVVVPVILGAAKLTLMIVGFATFPMTLLSAIINLDKLKKSKGRFIVATILTWVLILITVGLISYGIITYFDIKLTIPQ